jgi:hypothetical protein
MVNKLTVHGIRRRTTAAAGVALLGVTLLATGCGAVDDAKDKVAGKESTPSASPVPSVATTSTTLTAPPVPPATVASQSAKPVVGTSTSKGPTGGAVSVCDVLSPADVQAALKLPVVTSKQESMPWNCRFNDADGKQILYTSRLQLPALNGQTPESEVEEEVVKNKAEKLTDVGAPAAYYVEANTGNIVFAVRSGEYIIKSTIVPYGTMRTTDKATLVGLARTSAARMLANAPK